jgi:uncharacterized oligopeptide transporter (OPT) family protein
MDADLSRGHGLRGCAEGGRAGWIVCEPRVSWAWGWAGLYTLFQNENLLGAWPGTPNYQPNFDGPQQILKGAAIRADVTPEYLGVGYIIGPRVAAMMLAGGVFSWLVLMPAIVFFGKHLTGRCIRGRCRSAQMDPSSLWRTYVRPMGAGAVAASGLITLLRTDADDCERAEFGLSRWGEGRRRNEAAPRTEHDLPMSVVMRREALLLIVLMFCFCSSSRFRERRWACSRNCGASMLVVVFGFCL